MTERPGAAHFLREAVTWPRPWGLAIDGTTRWLAEHVTLAGDSQARRAGMLGRDGMPPGHALVLAPCQGIHTFGMRFPIDVVGVSRDGRVVTIVTALAPRRLTLSWRAFAIVELPAGRCRDVALEIGVVVRPQRPATAPGVPTLGPGDL